VSRFVRSFLGSRNHDASSGGVLAAAPALRKLGCAGRCTGRGDRGRARRRDVRGKKAPDLKRAAGEDPRARGHAQSRFSSPRSMSGRRWCGWNRSMASGARLPPRPSTSARCSGALCRRHTCHSRAAAARLRQTQRDDGSGLRRGDDGGAGDFGADDLFELHWYLKGLGQKTCLQRALCESVRCLRCACSVCREQAPAQRGVRQPSHAA